MDELRQEKSMVCAVYARSAVSNPSAIELQIEKCREAAHKRGWVVDERYTFTDDGVSGHKPMRERRGLGALIATAVSETPRFDYLLIEDFARLNRHVGEGVKMIEAFAQWGVTVYFVDPALDASRANAKVIFNVLAALDERHS
jgi:DNA invertase Pin-like site-specific DNA recombinase